MHGTLLRGRSSFPYFALVAFEAGGILRLLFLLLASPLAGFLYYFVSESVGIQVLVFAAVAGMKVTSIKSVARAVLPKFYSSDLHPETWRVFSSCGKRCVVTANLRIMVEPFLKEFLGADMVLRTEIASYRGRATGLVLNPGVLVGNNKADVLKKAFCSDTSDIGLGDRKTYFPFMKMCKESYVVPAKPEVEAVSHEKLPKSVVIYAHWALGFRIYIKDNPPPPAKKSTDQKEVIFICSHRTVIDAAVVPVILGRSVSTVSYPVSLLSEIISPIKTVWLTQDRDTDANTINTTRKLRLDECFVI